MKYYIYYIFVLYIFVAVGTVNAAVDFGMRTLGGGTAADSGGKTTAAPSKTAKPAPSTREELLKQRRDDAIKNQRELNRIRNELELDKAREELAETLIREQSEKDAADRLEQSKIDQQRTAKNAEAAANEKAKLNALTGRFTDAAENDIEDDPTIFQTEAQKGLPDAWNLLFDGKTFLGWRTQTKGPYAGGRFTIEDGMLCSDPVHPGLIYTTGQFGDISLEFEVKAEVGSIAYLLFRTSPDPKNLETSCYAIVIAADTNTKRCGSILGHQDSPEFLMVMDNKQIENGEHPWRKFRIMSTDSWIKVDYDRLVDNNYYAQQQLRRGFIGFLVTKGRVQIRNVYWNQTQAHWAFDGKNLAGWKPPSENPAFLAKTENSLLSIVGGPGSLESEDSHENFVLNLEFLTNHSASDSGLLFRCVSGLSGAGYECQLVGRANEEDKTKFVGMETGSLFRLADGRKVPSFLRKWNTLTVNAVDNHFQIWVNGIQTIDYFDRREPEETKTPNPRNGLKLSGGPIQLEGHNTATNIDFRNITIYDVPSRRPTK